MNRSVVHAIGLAVVLFLAPSVASAQSAITGLVRDTSGAVMPGVTVEVASPVLIEKVRSAVSDDQGRYQIIDLRPGVYTVTFTLPGFNTYKQEGLELPASFTATVNAEMRVGALEESVTVTGAAPVVDVQNTQRQVVLNRELMDAVPTARNYSGLASLMPGVRMSNTDVGGNQQMEQIYMTVNGSRQTDTTVQVDGMNLNSLMNDGQVQAYFSDAAMAEITYQTSGVDRRRLNRRRPHQHGPEGRRQHLLGSGVLRRHRRRLAGEQRHRRTPCARADHRVARRQDPGHQLRRRRADQEGQALVLRQLAAHRHRLGHSGQLLREHGEVGTGIEDQWIQNQMVRLTWQVNGKNKFSIYHDRYPKFKGHEVIVGAVAEWDTAAGRRDPQHALYYTGQAKWTSTISNRLLLEAGYSTNVEYLYIGYQPGVQKERNSPEWFNQIGKSDLITLRAYDGRMTPANGIDPKAQHGHRHPFVRHRQPLLQDRLSTGPSVTTSSSTTSTATSSSSIATASPTRSASTTRRSARTST